MLEPCFNLLNTFPRPNVSLYHQNINAAVHFFSYWPLNQLCFDIWILANKLSRMKRIVLCSFHYLWFWERILSQAFTCWSPVSLYMNTVKPVLSGTEGITWRKGMSWTTIGGLWCRFDCLVEPELKTYIMNRRLNLYHADLFHVDICTDGAPARTASAHFSGYFNSQW